MFNLLIDDWIKFQSYDNDFDPIEANRQFIRVYSAIPDRDVLFQNPDENPEDLLERLGGGFPECIKIVKRSCFYIFPELP